MPHSKLQRLDALIIDLDDTIVDSHDWTIAALQSASQRRGLDEQRAHAAIEDYLHRRVVPDAGIYNAILLGCGQSDSGPNIRALHEAMLAYRAEDGTCDAYPGVREALQQLAQRCRLILLADGPPDGQRNKVEGLQLAQFFPGIVYSDLLAGSSARLPDPRGLQEALRLLGCPAERVLLVADNPRRDFAVARGLGLRSCRVFSGPFRGAAYPDEQSRADVECTSLARLPELLHSSDQEIGRRLMDSLPFLRREDQPKTDAG